MSFGDNLRAARERLGLTQQQVAARLGVSKSAYCSYETNKRQPDVEKLRQLSDILQSTTDALLDVSAPADDADLLKAALWGGDQDLSAEDLDALWADVREYAAFKAQMRKKERL